MLFRSKAPFGLLFELLGAPGASVRGEGTYAGTTERVGSGAWVPRQRTDAGVRYVANPALSGDARPLLDAVNVQSVNVASELDAAYARGELDVRAYLAGTRPPVDQPKGSSMQQRPARRMRGLGMSLLPMKNGANVRHVPAFQDARVRRAVGMALEREPLLALDKSYTDRKSTRLNSSH